MRSSYAVDQVFVRPRGGGLELSFVLVALSGAIKHEVLFRPNGDAQEAVAWAARHLAARGDIDRVDRVRLRVEKRGALRDDAVLRHLFIEAFRGR
jgi:hypothetical protein